MYTIGDKIVYPMHGAGVIDSIEEKQVLGELRKYYIVKFSFGDMKIMIPCDATEHTGVREVACQASLVMVEAALRENSTEMSGNWNRRYRDNMEKLKLGDLHNVCEVVRNLMRVDRIKKLSTGEKKMLSNAKQILVSELHMASDRDVDEIARRIDELVLGGEMAL
ncbi:MAG: CarD family transcriptional regulator [Clostridiales Family XIII bacterium]|jgi:CarD family transcriptional regulator|nr:CarD family transcriptional regulator [Clostridiales Family XIII bacterium]